MSAVPHFSPEWLERYNERRRKNGQLPPANPKPDATPKQPKARKSATDCPTCARARIGGEFTDYSSKAVAVPLRGWDGKQTETEKRYNAQVLGGAGRFEAVCLYLPGGGRYTPDFMTVDDGVVTFHEVKGSYRLGSQGRAHTAFQEAAAAYPIWRFVWATERKGGGFEVKRFNYPAMNEGNS